MAGSISMSRSQQKERQKNSRMYGQTRYWKGRMEWLRFIQHPDRILMGGGNMVGRQMDRQTV